MSRRGREVAGQEVPVSVEGYFRGREPDGAPKHKPRRGLPVLRTGSASSALSHSLWKTTASVLNSATVRPAMDLMARDPRSMCFII